MDNDILWHLIERSNGVSSSFLDGVNLVFALTKVPPRLL